jgi:hypothetical protein
MPTRSSKPKKEKRDFSQVAFDLVAKLTSEKPSQGDIDEPDISTALNNEELRKKVMQEMGRRGGVKGGKARAESLTEEQKKIIASNAANARWSNAKKPL